VLKAGFIHDGSRLQNVQVATVSGLSIKPDPVECAYWQPRLQKLGKLQKLQSL